ncbi:MAG: ArsR family transcriptional regulator [Candidatus Njordarchaeales archaeon]
MSSSEDILRGNTLRIYLYMLRKREPVGVREIMRALGLRNPSLAHYHLNKLVQAGYVKQQGSKYILVKQVKIGILKQIMIIQGILFPRFALYFGLFLSFFMTEIVLVLHEQFQIASLISLVSLGIGAGIMLLETVNLIKELQPYIRETKEND